MSESLRRSPRFKGDKIVKKTINDDQSAVIEDQLPCITEINDSDGYSIIDKELLIIKETDGDLVINGEDQDKEDNIVLEINEQTKRNPDRRRKINEEDEAYEPSENEEDDEDDEDEEEDEEEKVVFKLDDSTEKAVIQFVEESTACFSKLYDKLHENGEENSVYKDILSSSKGKGSLYDLILSILVKGDYGENDSMLTLQTFGSPPDERKPLFNKIQNEHLKYLLDNKFNDIKTMYQKMAKNTCRFFAEKIQIIMMKRALEESDVEEESADTHNEEDISQEEEEAADIIGETEKTIDVAQAVPEQVFLYEYNFQTLKFSSKQFIQSTSRDIKDIAHRDSKYGYLYFILPATGKSYLFCLVYINQCLQYRVQLNEGWMSS
jgi:hypothetical protein